VRIGKSEMDGEMNAQKQRDMLVLSVLELVLNNRMNKVSCEDLLPLHARA